MQTIRRVLFAGGGTGGHLYMAIALAEKLRSSAPRTEFLFVGSDKGLERELLPPLGYRLETVRIGGLKNVGPASRLLTVLRLPFSLFRSLSIVRRFSPQVIVGVGGYSSGPVVAAGRLLRVPSVLIEPNVLPGLTNRLLTRFASAVAVAFEETARHFPGKARVTGIPVRREFFGISRQISTSGPLRLLVFGGSQGSRPINRLLGSALPHLDRRRVAVVHQTGAQDLDEVRRLYLEADFPAEVTAFLHDMPQRFENADLIVSRAGASTVAEITAAGRPALLIPFPQAADDHQRRNAEVLVKHGAALLLDQSETSPQRLAEVVAELERDRGRLVEMAASARSLSRPGGTEAILGLLEETVSGGGGTGSPASEPSFPAGEDR